MRAQEAFNLLISFGGLREEDCVQSRREVSCAARVGGARQPLKVNLTAKTAHE